MQERGGILLKQGITPLSQFGPRAPADGQQQRSSPYCSFPPASPGESGRDRCVLSVCCSGSFLRMGTEAILLCGCVLGPPPAASARWSVAEAIRITATGGICLCFLTSKFREVQMASLMAVRASHCLAKSAFVFVCEPTP